MNDRGQDSLTRLLLLWTAGIALCALNLGDEIFLLPLTIFVSTVVCIGMLCMRTDVQVWWVYGAVVAVAFLGMGFGQFWMYSRSHLDEAWQPALVAAYAVLGGVAALARWRHRWTYVGFLAVHVVLVALLLRSVPVVSDVQALMEGGAAALLRGESPYAITVPGVYGPEHDWNYGPGVLVDGRIMFGYPYLPLPLLAILPAYLIGDVRIALVLALLVTSVLIRHLATDRLGRLAAVLVLVLPVSWAMSLSYWVEPLLLLMVALAALGMARGRSSAAVWFGCFLASKQFAIVHLPYLWMLVRAHGRRAAVVALTVPAALCLVFLLWDAGALWHSAVDFHLRQPYRPDTVTLTPALERLLGGSPDFLFGAYGLVLGGCVSAVIAWRCRPSAATLASGVGLSLAVAVLFSKQGHANYWGLIGGALLIAVATWSESPRQAEVRWHTPASDIAEPVRTRP